MQGVTSQTTFQIHYVPFQNGPVLQKNIMINRFSRKNQGVMHIKEPWVRKRA